MKQIRGNPMISEEVIVFKTALMNIFQIERKPINLINAQIKQANVVA